MTDDAGMSRLLRTACLMLAAAVLLGVGGCRSMSRDYPGVPADQVWTAVRAAAMNPDYDAPDPDDRWNVASNEVWEEPGAARLEIVRVLDRIRQPPGRQSYREERTWKLSVVVESGTDATGPRATMSSRGLAVPMQVQEEGERFFAQVDELLRPIDGLPPSDG